VVNDFLRGVTQTRTSTGPRRWLDVPLYHGVSAGNLRSPTRRRSSATGFAALSVLQASHPAVPPTVPDAVGGDTGRSPMRNKLQGVGGRPGARGGRWTTPGADDSWVRSRGGRAAGERAVSRQVQEQLLATSIKVIGHNEE